MGVKKEDWLNNPEYLTSTLLMVPQNWYHNNYNADETYIMQMKHTKKHFQLLVRSNTGNELKFAIQKIDGQLNQIRNEGRQRFLKSNPENFSRILHDYSENPKAFILWKDFLEERIY